MLWLAIGAFGAHRFYLGRVKTGIALIVMLFGALIISAIGTYLFYVLMLDNGTIGDVRNTSTLVNILSGVCYLPFFCWLIWYLLDLIFINVMINKDRQNASMISMKQAENVFE